MTSDSQQRATDLAHERRQAPSVGIQDNLEEQPPAGEAVSIRVRALTAGLLAAVALFVVASPWPLYDKLHAIGRSCCAQIPSHTLQFSGRPMPIDARNSGIYLGVLLVLAMLAATGRWRTGVYVPASIRNVLLGLVAAMVFDGFNSMQHTQHLPGLYADSNAMRVITGVLSGVALTILVIPLFNRTLWRTPEPIAIAEDFTDLAGYIGAATFLILALLKAPALLYWPLSVGSILGLMITLTMVNAAVLVVGTRREHTIDGMRSLVPALLGGLVCTCIEITALDLWRIAAHR